jgi:hypothetical protein
MNLVYLIFTHIPIVDMSLLFFLRLLAEIHDYVC